jgi:S-adenosylmethionine-diacylglycerol 3-amino-3-carboxypropyl transferase
MKTKSFFSTLNYSSCNEDWRTERRALQVGPGDRVFCVTGSGDRPLHLLLDDPASISAVDLNPSQNHLLRLKASAISAFDYDTYASFLGLIPGNHRKELLLELAGRMEPALRRHWLTHRDAVYAGILYQGRWERYYRRISRIARTLRPLAINRLFEIRDLDQQNEFIRKVWDKPRWRLIFDILCRRTFSRMFFGDPAFFTHVDPRKRIGEYIYRGMYRCLTHHLARENFMLSLVFLGRLSVDDLPPYLSRDWFHILKDRLNRIEVRTAGAVDQLERSGSGDFTRFSLSDVPSFLDQAGFERMLQGLIHAAAPGARFCIRQFLTDHRIPEHLAGNLRRESELEAQLRADDRSFAYRFIVGTVVKES